MENYDERKKTVYNMYFDANNRYGWAMEQYLPCGCFEWMTEEEINNFNISLTEEIVRVDIFLK